MPDERTETAANEDQKSPPEADHPAGRRVVIVMPAYNAAKTLERTFRDIPQEIVDKVTYWTGVRRPLVRALVESIEQRGLCSRIEHTRNTA